MSIRRRLVLLAATAVAVAVVLGAVATFVVARAQIRGQVDDSLRATTSGVREVRVTGATRAPRPAGGTVLELPKAALGLAPAYAQLITPDGTVVRSTGAGRLPPVDVQWRATATGAQDGVLSDQTVDGVHVRVLSVTGPDGELLQVARPLTEVDATLRRLALGLGVVALGGIALAAGLGFLVARAALVPVARLTAAAEGVAATGDLSRRLPDQGRDEVHRLGASFNRVLAALRRSRDAQRQLVADASHELRTPLTSVRANVELLGRAPELPAAERERVVAASQRQLEELSLLVGDLVDLARDEPRDDEREELRLDLLVGETVQRARAHAPGREFAITVEPVAVLGAPSRLYRAVANLLDNAVKYGPPDAPVEVSVGADGGDAVVAVRDHGPGITPAELPLVFDRFYRAPSARGLPGSGLGLAIVRQVAEAHGGSARAESPASGGTRLELRLPAIS